MSQPFIGWADKPKNHPEVVKLRQHLESSNGITGLEVLKPGQIDRAVRLFRRDSFVVVSDVLNSDQVATLAAGRQPTGV